MSQVMHLYRLACVGNAEAMAFLCEWNRWIHAIDDIVDDARAGRPRGAEDTIAAFAASVYVFSHPFYRAHAATLQPVALLVANAYADSVGWEAAEEAGQRTMADVLRLAGQEMIFAVALVVGGYAHLRKVSAAVRSNSWAEHHTEDGKPV